MLFENKNRPTPQATAEWALSMKLVDNADQNTTTSGSVTVIASARSLNFFTPPDVLDDVQDLGHTLEAAHRLDGAERPF